MASDITVMKITVMKFGGTSIKDAGAFERVARLIHARRSAPLVVVVSAMSCVTDELVSIVQKTMDGCGKSAACDLYKPLGRYLNVMRSLLTNGNSAAIELLVENAREEIAEFLSIAAMASGMLPFFQDMIVSYGEQLSAALLAAVLRESGLRARYVDARHCILTDDEHGGATPFSPESDQRIQRELWPIIKASEIPVLGGFIAASRRGATTTLGRNGSDYTSALVGAALYAREIQIWTDVTGVLTADPRLVMKAETIPTLTYSEAADLSYFGAKVLHPKTIQPAAARSIPLRICNSSAPEETGTLISSEREASPHTVKAIACQKGITIVQITSARRLRSYEFLRMLFEVFERQHTVINVIATSDVSVSLLLDNTSKLPSLVQELELFGAVEVEQRRAIICVVGEGLRQTPGIAARVFSIISDINISLISQGPSSSGFTFVVDEERASETIRRLHEAFFERAMRSATIGAVELVGEAC